MGSDKELSQAGEKEEGTPLCEPLCVTYRDNHCCESAFDMEGGQNGYGDMRAVYGSDLNVNGFSKGSLLKMVSVSCMFTFSLYISACPQSGNERCA